MAWLAESPLGHLCGPIDIPAVPSTMHKLRRKVKAAYLDWSSLVARPGRNPGLFCCAGRAQVVPGGSSDLGGPGARPAPPLPRRRLPSAQRAHPSGRRSVPVRQPSADLQGLVCGAGRCPGAGQLAVVVGAPCCAPARLAKCLPRDRPSAQPTRRWQSAFPSRRRPLPTPGCLPTPQPCTFLRATPQPCTCCPPPA